MPRSRGSQWYGNIFQGTHGHFNYLKDKPPTPGQIETQKSPWSRYLRIFFHLRLELIIQITSLIFHFPLQAENIRDESSVSFQGCGSCRHSSHFVGRQRQRICHLPGLPFKLLIKLLCKDPRDSGIKKKMRKWSNSGFWKAVQDETLVLRKKAPQVHGNES